MTEFDRQLTRLLELEYPANSGMTETAFREMVEPLRAKATGNFVLTITREVVPVETMVPRLRLAGGKKPGRIDRHFAPGELFTFTPAKGIELPDARAYLLLDPERGEEFCGAIPERAMETITERDRTPLTIEEGIALVTQFPELLAPNKCFSLGGSRCGDRRVPALWISERAPKLGWCWAGNPHTWLGMASAAHRV
ncbi:hypothetical protein D5S17_09730 [Pseudonocardiaceae bacterium YIM PH 21723]|nr:hypothetical protein D5S17_09730 [Pseudonocardiaceae bacterium YIM PH 21723]